MSLVTSILSSPLFLAALHLSEGSEGEGGGLPLAVVPIIIFIILILIFLSSYFTSSGIQRGKGKETAVVHDNHDAPAAAPSPAPAPAPAAAPAAEPVSRTAVLQTEVAPTAITKAPSKAVVVPEEKVTAVVAVPEPEPEPEPTQPDNLKIVEGIGPKIEGILHAAGIKTFAQLAAATVPHLEKVVREDAGIRVAFPDTWPEQAKLAADGAWDALEKLQDELKGGRRA